MEKLTVKAEDGLSLSCLYSKAEHPKAMIQIIHGMVEHKERYEGFIQILNENGYTVIISDLRGHGESVSETYSLGHIGSVDLMVSDQYEVTKFIKKKNPTLPLYIFSHSMGTLISRAYIEKHDDEIKKLILCGTVSRKTGVELGVWLAWNKSRGKKAKKYSDLLWMMSNNASKDPSVDWISYNEENVKNYMADPLCGYRFTNFSNFTLFKMTSNLNKKKRYACKNPELPIMSISGADDRTTSGTAGVKTTMKYLMHAGYSKLKFIEYPNMRHEILNEKDNDAVIKDILEFYGE